MLVTMATHGANKDACFGGSVDLVVTKKMGFLTSQIDMIYITHNIIYYNITCNIICKCRVSVIVLCPVGPSTQ